MKVNQHLALCRCTTNLVIEIDHGLIVALHEINLDPFDAPLLELIQGRFELIVERLPNHPQNYTDVFLLAIRNQLFDVHIRRNLEQVAELVPAFVEDDVLDAVFRREIDVVLVSLRIDA